jgi:hypothetical protein
MEATSDPVTTALGEHSESTDIQPYFNAVVPERQTPAVATTSHAGAPSSPCTITAWFGSSWSAFEVPQARQAMSSSAKPSPSSPRIACAVRLALLWLGSPLRGSMA